jgi:hypothetical protein
MMATTQSKARPKLESVPCFGPAPGGPPHEQPGQQVSENHATEVSTRLCPPNVLFR